MRTLGRSLKRGGAVALAAVALLVGAITAMPTTAVAETPDWIDYDNLYMVTNCPYCNETHSILDAHFNVAISESTDEAGNTVYGADMINKTPDIVTIDKNDLSSVIITPLKAGTASLELVYSDGSTSPESFEVIDLSGENDKLKDTVKMYGAHPNIKNGAATGIASEDYLFELDLGDFWFSPEDDSSQAITSTSVIVTERLTGIADNFSYKAQMDEALGFGLGDQLVIDQEYANRAGDIYKFKGWEYPANIDLDALMDKSAFTDGYSYTEDSGLVRNYHCFTVTATWELVSEGSQAPDPDPDPDVPNDPADEPEDETPSTDVPSTGDDEPNQDPSTSDQNGTGTSTTDQNGQADDATDGATADDGTSSQDDASSLPATGDMSAIAAAVAAGAGCLSLVGAAIVRRKSE